MSTSDQSTTSAVEVSVTPHTSLLPYRLLIKLKRRLRMVRLWRFLQSRERILAAKKESSQKEAEDLFGMQECIANVARKVRLSRDFQELCRFALDPKNSRFAGALRRAIADAAIAQVGIDEH